MDLRGLKIGTLLGGGMVLIIGVMILTTVYSNRLSNNAQDIIQDSTARIFDVLLLQRDTDELFSALDELNVIEEQEELVVARARVNGLMKRAEITIHEGREKEIFEEEELVRAEEILKNTADISVRILNLKESLIRQEGERGGSFQGGFSQEIYELDEQFDMLRNMRYGVQGVVHNVIVRSDKEFRSAMDLVNRAQIVSWVVIGTSFALALFLAYFLIRFAKKIFDLKNEFINIIAHDLRNPVTAILGYLDIIKTGKDMKLVDVRKQLKIVEVATFRLRSQINNLLEVGRTEAGYVKINLEPVGVAALLDESVIRAKAFADTKGMKIQYDEKVSEDVYVLADKHKFTDVIDNLVSNAIKYNKKEGLVTITTRDEGEYFSILVTDTGYGIPEDKKDKIFKKYSRLESSSKERVGGTGLGLFTVKLAMDQMKGTIAFVTKVDKGTTFTVSFRKVKKEKEF